MSNYQEKSMTDSVEGRVTILTAESLASVFRDTAKKLSARPWSTSNEDVLREVASELEALSDKAYAEKAPND